MSDGDSIDRATAAMRTALCDRKMLRFDAPRLIGVVPRAGRTIERVERVERHGRHVEIEWDDSIVLHTNLKVSGAWHLYRHGEAWQRNHDDLRALIEVDGWVAVCFGAPIVETYRVPDASRHPGLGGLGPDLTRPDADLGRCIERLLAHAPPDTPLHDVLLDERVFCGVGNVYRSEVLWACELHPRAPVGDLGEADAVRLVNVAARLLRANLRAPHAGLAVYGRCGQRCARCGDSVRTSRAGRSGRALYWCPGCQVRLDPRRRTAPAREMDPHPAAARYLAGLPWRRTG